MAQKKTKRKTKKAKHSKKTIPTTSPKSKITGPQKVDTKPEQQIVEKTNTPLKNIDKKRMTWIEIFNISILAGLLLVNVFVLVFMRKDAELEKRAWVGLEDVIMQPIKAGEIFSCRLVFTNTGNTPAIDFQATGINIAAKAKVDDPAIQAYFESNLPPAPISHVPIAPKARFDVYSFSEKAIDDIFLKLINTGKIGMFVYAKAEYRDIFGNTHTTEVCMRYEPKQKKLVAYHKYNYMD
jgi:hypothetical protein